MRDHAPLEPAPCTSLQNLQVPRPQNNWRTAGKKPVLNIDLWQELLEVIKPHNVTWVKVKGHADNELNNRCDALARKQIEDNSNIVK